MGKLNVGILGATGAVGQNYALLLQNHTQFRVSYLAASPNSAGKTYREALGGRWFMDKSLPEGLKKIIVEDASNVQKAVGICDFIFSSFEGDRDTIKRVEMEYAAAGIPVISNNSAHRNTEDVPMIIPSINSEHAELIKHQRQSRGFGKGFVAVKPNCSIQSFVLPLYALMQRGHTPSQVIVTTQQALSGAGFPGVPSLAIQGNVIPYIDGEEEKTRNEPLKIFGNLNADASGIEKYKHMDILATCTRVPVIDGHLAIVQARFDTRSPSVREAVSAWKHFGGVPQELGLRSAPEHAIKYFSENDRPQPRKDKDEGDGMSVCVGRAEENGEWLRFIALSHNTKLGAAGGAIQVAELLHAKGYL